MSPDTPKLNVGQQSDRLNKLWTYCNEKMKAIPMIRDFWYVVSAEEGTCLGWFRERGKSSIHYINSKNDPPKPILSCKLVEKVRMAEHFIPMYEAAKKEMAREAQNIGALVDEFEKALTRLEESDATTTVGRSEEVRG